MFFFLNKLLFVSFDFNILTYFIAVDEIVFYDELTNNNKKQPAHTTPAKNFPNVFFHRII